MRHFITFSTLLILSGVTLQAKAPWVKQAQDLGFKDIKNCQACHSAQLPGLNELGDWLVAEQSRRKAQKIDLMWLSEYPKKS